MDYGEFIRTVDGGVSVTVLLFVLWRIEKAANKRFDRLMKLIDKLTNGE